MKSYRSRGFVSILSESSIAWVNDFLQADCSQFQQQKLKEKSFLTWCQWMTIINNTELLHFLTGECFHAIETSDKAHCTRSLS